MSDNFRRFDVGPDPFGRNWTVEFRWLQNAISIRHSDTIDIKYQLMQGENAEERVVALSHPDLLSVSKELNRHLTDPWCMKLAGLHLREMIETDRDMDKPIVVPTIDDLRRHAARLEKPVAVRR